MFTDSEVLDLLLEEDIHEIQRLQMQNSGNEANLKKKKKKKNKSARSDSNSESDKRTRKNSYSDENKVKISQPLRNGSCSSFWFVLERYCITLQQWLLLNNSDNLPCCLPEQCELFCSHLLFQKSLPPGNSPLDQLSATDRDVTNRLFTACKTSNLSQLSAVINAYLDIPDNNGKLN